MQIVSIRDYMKHQNLFFGKNKENIYICHLLKILTTALSIKISTFSNLLSKPFFFFSQNVGLDISFKLSLMETVLMKYQGTF